MSEVGFIVTYAMFYFTMFTLIGMGGYEMFIGSAPNVTIPTAPTDLFSTIGWFFANVGLFFSLLFVPAVDASIQFVALIFTCMTIGMIYIIMRMIIDIIPF